MSTVFERFNELGQKQDQVGLQSLMNELDGIELINVVNENIYSANFTEIWNYILKSFQDTTENHFKRINLVLSLLTELEKRDLPQSRIDTIINRLNLELPKFKSKDLAKICSLCIDQIQSKKTLKFVWKDLLPELMNVLVERETFTYQELDYTGVEYKAEFINIVCMSLWSPSIVTSLTTLFSDMQLTKEEHLKVTNKLSTYIEKLTSQEVPAFVHQLLCLCMQQNGKILFSKLQYYFEVRVYNNSNNANENSPDSMVFDLIETADNKDTIEAESTVLYHIHTAASMGYECIKEYLHSLKNVIRAPEFVLNPFQLMVLFTISAIPHYEEIVFDIVRPCIVRFFNEEQRKTRSAWFREIVLGGQKPEEVLSQVISFSIQDRDLVLSGLVKFAFVLLEVGSPLGRDTIAEKQWVLGNMILLKIVKKKHQVAMTILQTLVNHIVARQNVTQYIEYFYVLSRSMPLLMLENQSCILKLIDCLEQVPAQVADQLLDALVYLMKVSLTIRDHFIMYLRKALYSRSVEKRQMAVNGFLKLIKNLKISNMAVLSQESSNSGSFASGYSVFTQLSWNKSSQGAGANGFSNEALSFEILSILKRCFMQQVDVKSQLYEGLFEAVSVNPELGIPILDALWLHFNKFYNMDEEHLPPLNFDQITLRESQMVQEEPIGRLVQAIGLIVTKVMESNEHKENNTVLKFRDILNSLCYRMSNCELVHFELDDGTDILDTLPECQKKLLVLKEVLITYEALLGYKIFSWNEDCEKQGQNVNSLFQGYIRLVQFSKSLSKPKKAESKKAKIEEKTSQRSQAIKKDNQKLNKNIIPDTVWNFEIVKKALNLLHEPKLTWVSASEANVVKTKVELHQHVMQSALHLIQSIKRRKDMETQTKKMFYDHLTDISSLLFRRIVRRMDEFVEFDSVTTTLALECFGLIFNLINSQYKSNMDAFLIKIVSTDDKTEDMKSSLTTLVEIYEKIFEKYEEEINDDPEFKKLSLIAINTLNSLVNQIGTSTAISIQVQEWLKNYAYNNTLSLKNAAPFITLLFETHMKYKVSLTLFESISVSVGDVFGVIAEEEQSPENFKIVNEATANNIVLALCNSLKTVLEDVEAVTARLKSENSILSYPGENENAKEKIKTKEKGICSQLCFAVNILTNLSNLLIQPGNSSGAIFKSAILLFNTLSSLTKYFNKESSKDNLVFQRARFERLVKMAGKQLAPTIYKFILHLEDAQKESTQPSQHAKKRTANATSLKSKVLKETRLIPKVIYELEQFSRCVIQLSNKTKVDLSKYVGQGTVRDFRILHLTEALNRNEDDEESVDQHDETGTSRNDSRTSHDESKSSHDESKNEEEETGESDGSDATPPPSKKAKR